MRPRILLAAALLCACGAKDPPDALRIDVDKYVGIADGADVIRVTVSGSTKGPVVLRTGLGTFAESGSNLVSLGATGGTATLKTCDVASFTWCSGVAELTAVDGKLAKAVVHVEFLGALPDGGTFLGDGGIVTTGGCNTCGSSSGSSGDGGACITGNAASCTAAPQMKIGQKYCGDTSSRSAPTYPACSSGPTGKNEYWWFKATSSTQELSIAPSFNAVIVFFPGQCGDSSTICTGYSKGGVFDYTQLTVGSNYYVMVTSLDGSAGAYTIEVR